MKLVFCLSLLLRLESYIFFIFTLSLTSELIKGFNKVSSSNPSL